MFEMSRSSRCGALSATLAGAQAYLRAPCQRLSMAFLQARRGGSLAWCSDFRASTCHRPARGVVLRLALDLKVESLFAKNVDNIRALASGTNVLIKQIREMGFSCKWVVSVCLPAGRLSFCPPRRTMPFGG